MDVIKSKMGRKFEQKRKAKWVKGKSKFGQGLPMDDILLADHEIPAIVSRPKESIVVSKVRVQVANEIGDMPHLFWSTETGP